MIYDIWQYIYGNPILLSFLGYAVARTILFGLTSWMKRQEKDENGIAKISKVREAAYVISVLMFMVLNTIFYFSFFYHVVDSFVENLLLKIVVMIFIVLAAIAGPVIKLVFSPSRNEQKNEETLSKFL